MVGGSEVFALSVACVSPRSACCSTCHGMLAHFTRIGNLATPAKAASSPSARASCSVGFTLPVTSAWNCSNSLSTS